MSCENCEKQKDIAYVRIDKANVGVIGCDEHLRKMFGAIFGTDYSNRPIIRVRSE